MGDGERDTLGIGLGLLVTGTRACRTGELSCVDAAAFSSGTCALSARLASIGSFSGSIAGLFSCVCAPFGDAEASLFR